MAETSFDAVAGSLNSKITEFVILNGTINSNDNGTSFGYPQGFNKNNTMVVSFAINRNNWTSGWGWEGDNVPSRFIIECQQNGIYLYNTDTTVRGKPIRFLLAKY